MTDTIEAVLERAEAAEQSEGVASQDHRALGELRALVGAVEAER